MRVAVAYWVDVTDEERRAMRNHYGIKGLADRDEIKAFFQTFGEGNECLSDSVNDLQNKVLRDLERRRESLGRCACGYMNWIVMPRGSILCGNCDRVAPEN